VQHNKRYNESDSRCTLCHSVGSIDPDLDINIEFLRHGLVFKDIHNSSFPINSINLSKNDRLICGGDSGAIFCTEVAASS
jgi:hypothetical protein